MAVIRILRPEDVTLPEPIHFKVDREEAEETYRRAMAATESLRQFVENRDQPLFPENETASSRSNPRKIGFIRW
jgi:hypothetical protein